MESLCRRGLPRLVVHDDSSRTQAPVIHTQSVQTSAMLHHHIYVYIYIYSKSHELCLTCDKLSLIGFSRSVGVTVAEISCIIITANTEPVRDTILSSTLSKNERVPNAITALFLQE